MTTAEERLLPILRWDYEGTVEERQALLARCAADRDLLMSKVLRRYPTLEARSPSRMLKDIGRDVLDAYIIPRPLVRGQFALQDFQRKILWVNDRLEDFADLEGADQERGFATVGAFMLGHYRLHTKEMMAMMAEPGFEDSLPPLHYASWSARQEWEAYVYATVFLVGPESLARTSAGKALSQAREAGEKWSPEKVGKSLRSAAEALGTLPSVVRVALLDLGWLEVRSVDGEEQLRLRLVPAV